MSAVTSPPGEPTTWGRRRPPHPSGGRSAPRHRLEPARRPSSRVGALARYGVLPVTVCALAFGAGAVVRAALTGTTTVTAPARAQAGAAALLATAADEQRREIVDLLEQHYYRPVDAGRLLAEPVDQLPVALADPYTHYLKPETLAAWNRTDTGRYVGIGVVVETAESSAGSRPGREAEPRVPRGLHVNTVLPGGPAAAAGVRPGDEIAVVDGHDTTGLPTPDALELLRGNAGSAVQLTVRGSGGSRPLRLTRAEVRSQLVTSSLTPVATGAGDRPVRVGVIRLLEFDARVGDQVRAAAAGLVAGGAERLVLDLRGNPGGLVDEALSVVSAFVPAGTTVYSRQGLHLAPRSYVTGLEPVAATLPLTVLVDRDTASAAEIVAGALQDGGRATVSGTTTYGKGVMQQIWPLPAGGGLKLTVAEFLTPAGHRIQLTGIHPDRP